MFCVREGIQYSTMVGLSELARVASNGRCETESAGYVACTQSISAFGFAFSASRTDGARITVVRCVMAAEKRDGDIGEKGAAPAGAGHARECIVATQTPSTRVLQPCHIRH